MSTLDIDMNLDDLELGKLSGYPSVYMPSLLQAIPRSATRDSLFMLAEVLPFTGVDIWNAFELSWLNPRGKPQVAMAEIRFPCTTPALIESKSLKLYLNSFAGTKFGSEDEVRETMESDLSVNAESAVEVRLMSLAEANSVAIKEPEGECLDTLDIDVSCYETDASLISVELGRQSEETLYSSLFRSVCPVTGQPDWATVQIQYSGRHIKHDSLLRYLVSFREHPGFHEQCVEQIFMDLMQAAAPDKLTVNARFLRRGGLDINPVRTNQELVADNARLIRQ